MAAELNSSEFFFLTVDAKDNKLQFGLRISSTEASKQKTMLHTSKLYNNEGASFLKSNGIQSNS